MLFWPAFILASKGGGGGQQVLQHDFDTPQFDEAVTVLEQQTNTTSHPNLALIHIPKTGGTTIEMWGKAHGFKWGATRSWPKNNGMMCPGWHVPRGVYTQLAGQDPYEGNSTFCVVRHPFTRAVSEYLYSAQLAVGCHPEKETCEKEGAAPTICNTTNLNDWVLSELGRVGPAVRAIPYHGRLAKLDYETGQRLRGCHWLPQWMYVESPGQGKMCEKVLHFENLDSEWRDMVGQVYPAGKDHALSSFTRNKALCSMKVSDLNNQARWWLHDLYSRDFDQFGYAPNATRSSSIRARARSMLFEDDAVHADGWVWV